MNKVNSISLCRFLFLEVFITGTCSMALTRQESILDDGFKPTTERDGINLTIYDWFNLMYY
ncbi:hypothetical protein JP0079_13940 [Helicobacter pylori]|nr:hypothetical protein JP0079_13940 [Helicobacter pylori]